MTQRKAAQGCGRQAPASLAGKVSLHKTPAFEKIHKAILETGKKTRSAAAAARSIRILCTELLENIVVPPAGVTDGSYSGSIVFKTQLALICQINRLLMKSAADSRQVSTVLTRQLLTHIRRHRSDTAKKNRYLLLLWMCKFPLIEQILKRKKMQYREDLYQGSYAILLRCAERCDPERTESFNAYFAKALQWNIPRILWQIKNEREIAAEDRIISQGSAGGEMLSAPAAVHVGEGKEGKKEILDTLLQEWWRKIKAGVKEFTGKTEFSLETIRDVYFKLKTGSCKKVPSKCPEISTLVSAKSLHADGACFDELTEFSRHITLLYIACRMLKQGTNQAQIARELQLSRERIRQYVQLWIKPYIKSKLKNIGLSTARQAVSEAYSRTVARRKTARHLLQKFFTEDASITPPPLVTRVNHSKFIKLFKLTIHFPKRIIVPGQKLKLSAEVFGKEHRIILKSFSHNENIGWCLAHWDARKNGLVSSTSKTTVTVIPSKIPEEKLQKQVYRHFVKAVRRGIAAEPPEMKLRIKTFAKYPCIATAIFGKSSSLYLNLTDTFYSLRIVGVQLTGPEKSILVRFEAEGRHQHVEYKQVLLSGDVQWNYRALIAKKDTAGNVLFFPLRGRNMPPVHFEHMYH